MYDTLIISMYKTTLRNCNWSLAVLLDVQFLAGICLILQTLMEITISKISKNDYLLLIIYMVKPLITSYSLGNPCPITKTTK